MVTSKQFVRICGKYLYQVRLKYKCKQVTENVSPFNLSHPHITNVSILEIWLRLRGD
jgi:hypothetical protein